MPTGEIKMECHECFLHDVCIPVPGSPGQCALPVECEQCIERRLGNVDADIASMQRDIVWLKKELSRHGKLLKQVKKQSDDLRELTTKVAASSIECASNATRIARLFDQDAEMTAKIAKINEIVQEIKATVF